MPAYYNEIDPYAAQWLRNLIRENLIAPGDVDERSIVDVRPDDLRGYEQCHFFAGIGGWSLALRLAGWDDARPVWTGSCPCQPFSAAGAGKAADDERHLWPAWFPLIAELRPAIVFGEQVEAAVGWGWLDAVFADLEGEGYACGAAVLPACGVGAPHIRQRLWFVADSTGDRRREERALDGRLVAGDRAQGQSARLEPSGVSRPVADTDSRDASTEGLQRGGEHGQRAQDGRAGSMGNAVRPERRPEAEGREDVEYRANCGRQETPSGQRVAGPFGNFWSDAEWLPCTDGKARPVGPGSFPLGHGIRNRASKLRAYGNAIVPQAAAAFIAAAEEARLTESIG